MKVSLNWLKELVDIDMNPEELAHALTMAGLEVEEIAPVAAAFDHIVVAEVKSISKHPNADKLSVCEVDVSTGTLLQIVCGAPNVAVGMRVPCALVGAKLPGLEIKHAKLRGVESNGMLCSARELGISDEHAGLLALAGDAPLGQDIRVHLDLDDAYFTLKLTPNRGDCLSMIGIARDVAAVTGGTLKVPAISPVLVDGAVSMPVTVAAPTACGRYLGRVITGLNARAATPDWMKRRLERAGFRAIAALIDITNYVNLERGQPMHAFDYEKLVGGIAVRFANAGESMNLLNSQHVELKPDMLLITDGSGPVAIGGVMGGLESMVTDATTSIFFESAYFDPDVIQGKTRTLGINSDAAYRFERGVDPEFARDALECATQLALEICGGADSRTGTITEAIGVLPGRNAVTVRPARVEALLGMNIPVIQMVAILTRLSCIVIQDGEVLLVTPPSYRFDLKIEEDFVEEIARINGYEKIPSNPPKSTLPMLPVPESRRSRTALRRQLVEHGYQEAINYSFTPPEWEADFAGNDTPVRVANPISSQMSVMRTTLIGGLIATLRHNLNRGESRLKIFEMGRCFLSDVVNLEQQPERLGALVYGARFPEQWGEGGQNGAKADFYSVKGDLEPLLLGRDASFEKTSHPSLHPGRSAMISVAGRRIGMLGELHPRLQQKYELPGAPILFEMDVAALQTVESPWYRSISRMQTLRRDIAVLVDDSTEMQDLLAAINTAKIASVIEISPFDVYRGENVGRGKKSVAFRILMQDTDRTLVDSDADNNVAEILKVLYKEFGATLRK